MVVGEALKEGDEGARMQLILERVKVHEGEKGKKRRGMRKAKKEKKAPMTAIMIVILVRREMNRLENIS